jgi:hypothetical protein
MLFIQIERTRSVTSFGASERSADLVELSELRLMQGANVAWQQLRAQIMQ